MLDPLNLNSNALVLLNFLSEERKWTISELAKRTKMRRSSVHYWLKKFMSLGIVDREEKYGKFIYWFGKGNYFCVKGTLIKKEKEGMVSAYGCPYRNNCEVKTFLAKGCKLREELEQIAKTK